MVSIGGVIRLVTCWVYILRTLTFRWGRKNERQRHQSQSHVEGISC